MDIGEAAGRPDWRVLDTRADFTEVAAGPDEQVYVAADDGRLYERVASERWERRPIPTNDRLYDLSLGQPDLVVGRSDTVFERPRSSTPTTVDGAGAETERTPAHDAPGIDRIDTE